jgi:UDP-N-acetylmuramyl tripeptide synthase
MAGGLASALLASLGRGGRLEGSLGLFEVDEFWLDRVAEELRPRALVLGNLFRDQLDRYGELETVADRWAAVVDSSAAWQTKLMLNADDPLVADLGRDRAAVSYFGVQDDSVARPSLEHASDSKHCRRCGAPYRYDAVYLGHLGRYHCPRCGARRPDPTVAAENVRLDGLRGSRFRLRTPQGTREVQLPLPGLYNVYNALAAAALTLSLDSELDHVVSGLESVRAAFGRGETVRVGARDLSILLVKNPAGANEVLRTLALEPGEHDLLGILNDNVADGRDVSWVWDADFEILAPRLRHVTCSGTRASELALRMKYAGVPTERITVEGSVSGALDQALADGLPHPTPAGSLGEEAAPGDGHDDGRNGARPLYAIPTYTAMLELREVLRARGHVESSWT